MWEKPVDSFVEGSVPIVFSRVSRFVLRQGVCGFFLCAVGQMDRHVGGQHHGLVMCHIARAK